MCKKHACCFYLKLRTFMYKTAFLIASKYNYFYPGEAGRL